MALSQNEKLPLRGCPKRTFVQFPFYPKICVNGLEFLKLLDFRLFVHRNG